MFFQYDIIVVGAGHAGCEAAAAAAKMGSSVLLITMHMQTIAQMSCNPAMGGIAKGQIIREIDALGGMTGIVSDKSMLQFRMLNKSKGPAMWSPRTQNDRMQFAAIWRSCLEQQAGIDFWQDMVQEIIIQQKQVIGVKTSRGMTIQGKAVILTNGTFLNGVIHIGEKQIQGGRAGEKAAVGLTHQLVALGFKSGRMKTGTPPRVDGRTLDYTKMEIQPGDDKPGKFSFTDTQPLTQQKSCYITYTNQKVHQILEKGFDQLPLLNARIQGKGPRYCPSIEDKIIRFADKERHQLFVEPEGWDTVQIYVNGFSTSLPESIQYEALRSIVGFENVKMFCPGYAIEYDYFPATQLHPTLATRLFDNLYFAGQINGTTGYEEAACQGLMAGINAHRKIYQQDPFILERSDAYIGVLLDDLVYKTTDEPYRMFTSRAEFRLLLRQDNADLRLTARGHQIGLADDHRLDQVLAKQKQIKQLLAALKQTEISPDYPSATFQAWDTPPPKERQSSYQLLKRPEMSIHKLCQFDNRINQLVARYDQEVLEQVEIQIKYESYLQKEQEFVNKTKRLAHYRIPADFKYDRLQSLSAEGLEKLKKYKPTTLGDAEKISGVSIADISILMVYIGRS